MNTKRFAVLALAVAIAACGSNPPSAEGLSHLEELRKRRSVPATVEQAERIRELMRKIRGNSP